MGNSFFKIKKKKIFLGKMEIGLIIVDTIFELGQLNW